jgi:putative membrane protein
MGFSSRYSPAAILYSRCGRMAPADVRSAIDSPLGFRNLGPPGLGFGRAIELPNGREIMWGFKLSAAAAAMVLTAGVALAQGAKPNDAQIAHIAYTAGNIDIAAAQQAVKKARNKQVKAFAQDMIRDHTAVNNKALALVKKLHVTPEDNPTSQALKKQADDTRAQLAKMNGPEFDKAYIQNEVTYHQTVNGALQNTLIPSAQNPELKSLLETGLKIFQGHQQHAEQVAASLK